MTEALPVVLIAESPIEDDPGDLIRLRVSRDNITPTPFTVSITTVNGNATITGADLSKLRPGDAIANANITGLVQSVDVTVTPHTATISANATEGATANATVTPPTFDLALYEMRLLHTISGSSLTVKVELHRFTGSTAGDANADGKDDSTTSDETRVEELTMVLNLDSILAQARLPRT